MVSTGRTLLGFVAAAVLLGYATWSDDGYQEGSRAKTPEIVPTIYEMNVELVYRPTGEEVNVRYPFSCKRWRASNLAGESFGRSELYPVLYGERLPGGNGDGVVVRTPNLCGVSLPLERVVPENYMPVVYHVPDVDNAPDIMVAHLSEASYDQEVSKFEFRKASITKLSFQDGDPLPELHMGTMPEGFAGAKFDDRTSYHCYSALPLPIPEELKDEIRLHWPETKPDWWIFEQEGTKFVAPFVIKVRKYWEERSDELYGGDVLYYGGHYIRRPNGGGNLFVDFAGDSGRYGLAPRIPLKVTHSESGNPDSLPVVDFVTDGGYDQGFGFCQPFYKSISRFGRPEPDTGEMRGGIFRVNGNEIWRGDIYKGQTWGTGILIYRDEKVFKANITPPY